MLMDVFTQLTHYIPLIRKKIYRIRFRADFNKLIVNVLCFIVNNL